MTNTELDVYETEKIAKTTLKAGRWIALGITLAIFITPQITAAPFLATKSAESTRVTLETVGIPTATIPNGIPQYRRLDTAEVD